MVKPWDHTPGKIYRPNVPDEVAKERLEAREEFGKKWEAIFGVKKMNNMEDNNGQEEPSSNSKEAGQAQNNEEA